MKYVAHEILALSDYGSNWLNGKTWWQMKLTKDEYGHSVQFWHGWWNVHQW
jgi:hypothetical protein